MSPEVNFTNILWAAFALYNFQVFLAHNIHLGAATDAIVAQMLQPKLK